MTILYDTPPWLEGIDLADLERQLAETDAALGVRLKKYLYTRDMGEQLWDYAERVTAERDKLKRHKRNLLNNLCLARARFDADNIDELYDACGNLTPEQVRAAIALAEAYIMFLDSDDGRAGRVIYDTEKAFRAAMAKTEERQGDEPEKT